MIAKTKEAPVKDIITAEEYKEMSENFANEHALQKKIVEGLRFNGIMVFETDVMSGIGYFDKKDPRRYRFIEHHKKMGWQKGTPDLVLVLKDACLFVEVKNGKSYNPSFEQKSIISTLQRLGHHAVVWRSLDDFRDFIKGYKNYLAREVKDGKLTADDYIQAFGIKTTATCQKQKAGRSRDNQQQS